MCGIFTLIDQNQDQISHELIIQSLHLIEHRGPDAEGVFIDQNVGLGHRRLSIIDLNEAANQPMKGLDGLVITYNGEIYNYIELRSELEALGYVFKTQSDTEVLLASYHCWGERCLDKLNGMWAFVIYDPKNNILFASRDRFGIKPLYFSKIGSCFAIASEIKQFTVLPGWKARLNEHMALDYFYYGATDHCDETLFKGVFQLRGGQSMIYHLDSHRHEVSQWYVLADRIQPFEGTVSEAVDAYYVLFQDAVNLRLRSDVKVGSSLSGGLDSSSIVCMIHKLLSGHDSASVQEVVSACYDQLQYDERRFSREVVAKTGVTCHEVFPSYADFMADFDSLVKHQDEPFGSMSIFASWSVFKEASRRGLTVMLDGQGPDEVLGGYLTCFSPFLASHLRKGSLLGFVNNLHSISSRHGISALKLLALSMFQAWVPSVARLGMKQVQLRRSYPWLKPSFHRDYFSPKPLSVLNTSDTQSFFMQLFLTSSIPKILHVLDRNSMSFSIESRVPFLDYRLVELSLGLSLESVISQGQTKAILRQAMSGLVPDAIVSRQDKMGFVTPEDVWLRQEGESLKEVLFSQLPPFIDERLFRTWYDSHIEVLSFSDHRLFKLLCFQKWADSFSVSYH